MCCQKVSEAEAMVYGGVQDVLVTNEIVGRPEVAPSDGLASSARIAVCVDDPAQIVDLSDAAGEVGVDLPVHVEVNMGGERCGVEPGEPALALARRSRTRCICASPGCRPITARHSTCAARTSASSDRGGGREGAADARPAGRATASPAATSPAPAPARSRSRPPAGSTPSCRRARTSSWTPITGATSTPTAPDPRLRAEPLRLGDGDEPSHRGPGRGRRGTEGAERGFRAATVWTSPPRPTSAPPTSTASLGISSATNRLKLGDKIRLVPGHCDPTVNLYDWYVGVRDDRVEALWPITARGAVY